MKTKCDFCKTEYSLDKVPGMPVKCVVCGHVWNVVQPTRKNSWLMFFASVCALLSAIVFTIAVIVQHQAKKANSGPLIATVSAIETVTDDDGNVNILVKGNVKNVSDDIYGVPDLLIVSLDKNDKVLAKQKFMPSATLLDAGATVEFNHILAPQPNGVKKITAKLINLETPQDEKK